MNITDEQKRRLLHAYETLLMPAVRYRNVLSDDEYLLLQYAWTDVKSILLGDEEIKPILHGTGEWEGGELRYDGHIEAMK